MTEVEKCLAGEYYNCHDKTFLDFKSHARTLLQKYNALAYEETELKTGILKELFGGIGTKVSVASPFICDYGCNIHIGNNVSINMNCTFVDCNKIIIGDDVLIASNVQLYTAAHPIEFAEIIYVFLTIFLYLLKCPQSLILSALRVFCFCGKPHISRLIFLYFLYQTWLKSW